jgi:hypothetical protein
MLFNPIRTRQVTVEGGLARALRTVFDPKRPMGNIASHELEDVISAWLVGLHREIEPVIARSLEWIDKAIAEDEEFGVDPNGHRTTLHWAKGIGEWLRDETLWEGEWYMARIFQEARWRYEKRPWPMHEIIKSGLDDYLAFAFLAGAPEDTENYEAGIEMYERWTGKSGPVSLSGTLKPRELGYALCLHWSGRQSFDEEALFEAGRKMLQANLQETWLGGGQCIRAATWLMIVYWHRDRTLTPLQCVLKAYDNMPDVPKPDFVPNL